MKDKLKKGFRAFIWRLFAIILNILVIYVFVISMVQIVIPFINVECFLGTEMNTYNYYNALYVGPMMAVDTLLIYLTYKLSCKFCERSWHGIEKFASKIFKKLDDTKSKKDAHYSVNDDATVIK